MTTKTDTAEKNAQAGQGHSPGGPLALVVADRGHVWVGYAHPSDAQGLTRIDDARIVRRWGTDKGLNQLAMEGPRPNTVLDMAATVLVATRAIIVLIPCEPSKWIA